MAAPEQDVSIDGHRLLMVNSALSRDQFANIATTDTLTAAPWQRVVIVSTAATDMNIGSTDKLWLGLDSDNPETFGVILMGNYIAPASLTS